MSDRKRLGAPPPRLGGAIRRRGLRRMVQLLAVTAWAHNTWADAVFDGTIGPNPAGTLRAGQFEIREGDGAVAGNNLFHSFSAFGVERGEMATFSHQAGNIDHIIARVSGSTATEIYGAMQVRQDLGGSLGPTDAALWLINPNGIVVGDGAIFDPQSTFVLSTANRLGFANGDSFHSHEPVLSSVLSVAEPAAFGFLDRQDLPAGVTARGITVAIADPDDNNIPLLLPNLTLVGTSIDPAMPALQLSGDIGPGYDASSGLVPLDSSTVQAINLALGALAPGGVINIDASNPGSLSADPGAALGGIRIDNTRLQISDFGFAEGAGLSLLADSLLVSGAYIDTLSLNQTVPLTLRSISHATFSNTVLQSATAGPLAGGDIRIDSQQVELAGGLIGSQGTAASGAPGNILLGTSASLPMQSFNLSGGQLQSISLGAAPAGDILLNVQGDLQLAGQPGDNSGISSINAADGPAGDILLLAERIRGDGIQLFSAGFHPGDERFISLQAGAGGLELVNSAVTGLSGSGRTGASLLLESAADMTLAVDGAAASISTGTSSNLNGGNIFITAQGNLNLSGNLDISTSSTSDTTTTGVAGTIALSGRNIVLDGIDDASLRGSIGSFTSTAGDSGNIVFSAAEDIVISAPYDLTSNTIGAGNSGAVLLQGGRIVIDSPLSTNLSTSSLDTGDAGIISLAALDTLELSGAFINSLAVDQGAAGFILLDAATMQVQDSVLTTATRANDAGDTPAQISLSASGTLDIRDSNLQSNSVGQAPAGQVFLSAGEQLRVDDVSMQTATTASGTTGSILLVSGGDITLSGPATELLSNAEGSSDAGDVSLLAQGSLLFEDGGFIQTSAVGSGDAGTILLSADEVSINLARIEGTAENGGGGDVNIFGRDILIDGDPGAGGIVFITADSQSSDAAGNGGSITLGDPLAPADLVLVRYSALLANANAGNGGRININADNFLRDALSSFQVTSTLGDAGSLEINAPEQDISAAVAELDVALLDATNLIQDRCAVNPEDASSLVVRGEGVMAERYDDYLTSGTTGADPGADAAQGSNTRLGPGASHTLIALRREAACNPRH
ncbi:filamentous hemagglutinin N-terminal domain-containing protein [Parahaliea aestuarii]|uniref:Filamentous hemagglutinin N-terminal domain-containing protein n=1 Tax=Parahaliea aestuarii TaxID=1852021 RepID=A0A5C8ZPX2_9GAMM|nr:filamentous hemagglutinin N-terminal domain-containing protein [Parahaliea aestuarii]TXS90375.1 filamentous hemagglutinin N-terminal domain-containing protein [Parahaliea aestuarii]